MKMLLLCISTCLLLSCTAGINPYSQTYKQLDTALPITTTPEIVVSTYRDEETMLEAAQMRFASIKRRFSHVKWLGLAYCYDTSANKRSLINQAKAVGANLVLLYRKPGKKIKMNFPITVPDKRKTTTIRRSGDGTIRSQPRSILDRSPDTNLRFDYDETETIEHPQTYTTHNIPYTKRMYAHIAIFIKR